jgi:hypothetical protein
MICNRLYIFSHCSSTHFIVFTLTSYHWIRVAFSYWKDICLTGDLWQGK